MIYLATYDPETGAIGQAYGASTTEALADLIPAGAPTIEVPDLDAGLTLRVENGALVPRVEPIEKRRAGAIARVELRAANARARWLTPSVAASGVYLAKEAEARDWLAAGEPADLTDWPFLASEIGLTAPTAWHLAQLWLGMAAAWRATAATIETARLRAKAAIAAAETDQEIQAAVEEMTDTLSGL